MRTSVGLFCVAAALFLVTCCDARGVNGGMNCAACTILTGVIQQHAYLKTLSLFEAAKRLCKKLPMKYQHDCYETVTLLEPLFVDKKFLKIFTPDIFCYALRACYIDPGEDFCHLFPKPNTRFEQAHEELTELLKKHNTYDILSALHVQEKDTSNKEDDDIVRKKFIYKTKPKKAFTGRITKVNFCKMPIVNAVCDVFMNTFERLTPLADMDGDGFSVVRFARGSDWRGKDCNDFDAFIHPGAQTLNSDSHVDGNCNGIRGIDPTSGRPWEEVLCAGTDSKGIIYLGDSFGAHWHFPESWMNPNRNDIGSIATIAEIILDEFDWPELSYATGFVNSSYPNLINGTTDSLYLRLRNNNLCSHRDYQNGAKNAAMAWDGANQADKISRSPSDKPVLLLYAMVGNDVCNRFRDTIQNMTTPDQLHRLVTETLEVLDKKLPLNSDVVLVSLINGSFIYDTMAERIHPLGSVLNNIKYKDLYSWFSCMEIGPCEGWMTPNATLRQITANKASELSNVLKSISTTSKYKSFKLHYMQNPFNTVVDNWVTSGRHSYELIDPIDSTHPVQIAQPLMADAMWNALKGIGVIGPENPNNEKIKKMFGDQGGH